MVVENVDVSCHGLGGDDVFLVLRHVSSPVDLALMINLNLNIDSGLFSISNTATANSICIIIQNIFLIVSSVFRWL